MKTWPLITVFRLWH